MTPTPVLNPECSQPDAEVTPWSAVTDVLATSDVFCLSTVRPGGRPHVSSLLALWRGETLVFCTGFAEVKAKNLEQNRQVVLTTSTSNAFSHGLDVMVEGVADRVTDGLEGLADEFAARFGEDWRWTVDGDAWRQGEGTPVYVFEVAVTKVLAISRSPYSQTTYRV